MVRLRLNYYSHQPSFMRDRLRFKLENIINATCEHYKKPEKHQWIVDDLDAMRLKMIIVDDAMLSRYVDILPVEPFEQFIKDAF